jgi:hypothetical protein
MFLAAAWQAYRLAIGDRPGEGDPQLRKLMGFEMVGPEEGDAYPTSDAK